VIAKHKEQRFVKTGNDVLIVVYVQIARTQHAIDTPESIPYVRRIDNGIDMVGNRHDVQPPQLVQKNDKKSMACMRGPDSFANPGIAVRFIMPRFLGIVRYHLLTIRVSSCYSL